jgi:DNA topoisomerase I
MALVIQEKLIDQEVIAEEFGLRYLEERKEGIRRVKAGSGFEFFNQANHIVTKAETLERIESLKIPPAWEDVWISPYHNSHLQATGLDARGRRQYLYHKDWVRYRCENKFDKMSDFGEALPLIRKAVEEGLQRRGFDKRKVLSAVVGLLDHTLIRIGNKKFEAENNSYGLTTLKNKHIKSLGQTVVFEFVGKSGIKQILKVTDSRLARVVKKCRDLPGQRLFQYIDENGERCAITSEDVNEFLKEITCRNITSKDFRTWGASTHAIKILQQLDVPKTAQELNRNFNQVVQEVAKKLGNTASVCRNHYLHPIVFEAYSNNAIVGIIQNDPRFHLKGSKMLSTAEKLFLKILDGIGH